ncbi:MAG: type 4a pilus biogenesis protein PilO [Planctomycetota bacterium]|nr:type 4a pilus biogenesis protein PilO [Planctomycetota bacterium]
MTARTGRQGSLLAIDALGVSICLLLSVVGYFGVVYPHAAGARVLSERRDRLEDQTTTARQLATSRAALNRRLESAHEKLSDHALALEAASELNRRLARLGDLATECGLGVEEIHVGEIVPRPHYRMVPLELKCRARFPQAVLFLQRLHRTAPDVGVWSLELSGNPRTSPSAATAEFDLAWYAAPKPD